MPYIKSSSSVSPSVCDFCLSPRGTNTSFTQERGGTNIFTQRGGQTFNVGGSGGYDDVYEEVDVSEANIFVSEVIRLSVGARIYRGP